MDNIFIEAILFGLVLSADSFSAALAMGFRPHTQKDVLKFALSSGGAEGLVTYSGAILGAKIVSKFADVDHWVAFTLLFAVAAHMVFEGIQGLRQKDKSEDTGKESFHSFYKVLIVSFATSLDALGVGVGLGVGQKDIGIYAISIGLCAFLSTILGMGIARKVSSRFGDVFTLLGAAVLFYMAFEMLKI